MVSVKGIVEERQSKNPNIKTGDIEISLSEVEILNESKIPPFTIDDNTDKSLKNLVEDYSIKADSIIQKLTPEFDKRPNLILLSEFLLKRNY